MKLLSISIGFFLSTTTFAQGVFEGEDSWVSQSVMTSSMIRLKGYNTNRNTFRVDDFDKETTATFDIFANGKALVLDDSKVEALSKTCASTFSVKINDGFSQFKSIKLKMLANPLASNFVSSANLELENKLSVDNVNVYVSLNNDSYTTSTGLSSEALRLNLLRQIQSQSESLQTSGIVEVDITNQFSFFCDLLSGKAKLAISPAISFQMAKRVRIPTISAEQYKKVYLDANDFAPFSTSNDGLILSSVAVAEALKPVGLSVTSLGKVKFVSLVNSMTKLSDNNFSQAARALDTVLTQNTRKTIYVTEQLPFKKGL